MPETTILAGPPGEITREPFFEEVLARCRDPYRASALRYIVPTARRRVEIERALIEFRPDGHAITRPRVITLDRFVRTLFTQHVDGRVISWRAAAFAVETVLTEAPDRFPVLLGDRTVPLAGLVRGIVHTIRELKRFAVDAARLNAAARGNAKVSELATVLAEYSAFLDERQWTDARDVFPCVATSLADSAVARRWLHGIDWIVFDGFVEFSPSELPIVTSIAALVQTTFVFDADPELVELFPPSPSFGSRTSPRQHAGPFAATGCLALGRSQAAPAPQAPPVRLIEARTREEEAERVAAEVKRLLVDGAPQRAVAIAVPNMRQCASLVQHALEAHGVPCAVTRHGSVLDSPVAAALMLLLETPARGFERADVVELFRSRFVHFADGGAAISSSVLDALARDMRVFRGKDTWLDALRARLAHLEQQRAHPQHGDDDEGDAVTSIEAELRRLRPLEVPLRRALDALDELRTSRPTVEFLRTVRDLLDRSGIIRRVHTLATTTLNGREHVRALNNLQAALDEGEWLAQACRASRAVTLDEFIEQMRSLLAEPGRSAASPDEGVELVDIRTAVERRTRHLFVTGLVEGAIPVAARRDALLSPGVRAAVGLPSREELAAAAAIELYRALTAADESLTLSRPTFEKDAPLLPALPFERIARGLGVSCEPCAAPPTSTHGLLCALGHAEAAVLSLDALRRHGPLAPMRELDGFAHGQSVQSARDASPGEPTPYAGCLSPPLHDQLRGRYTADYQFSATELEAYARCPFRFFAARVLRIEEPVEPEEEITPRDKGEVFHTILADFYRRWQDHGHAAVTQDNASEALDLLRAVADEHLGNLPYRGAVWQKFRDRITGQRLPGEAVVPGLLERFLQVEHTKLAPTGHRPRHFELGFGKYRHREQLDEASNVEPLAIDTHGRRVLMHGVIDRVDVNDEHGTFCVLDYKSGSNVPRMDDIHRGPSLQLPVYVLAARMLLGAGSRFAAAGYYQTKDAADCGLRGVIADASLAEAGAAPSPSKHGALQPAAVNDWLAQEAKAIADIVLGIEAGRFEVTPLGEEQADCRSCDFKHICRYRGITLRTFERQP